MYSYTVYVSISAAGGKQYCWIVHAEVALRPSRSLKTPATEKQCPLN